MRRLASWLDGHLLLAGVILLVAYFGWGLTRPEFSRSSELRRGQLIDRLRGDIQIGCLWNSHGKVELYPPSSYLLGARLAVQEINAQMADGKGSGLLLPGADGSLVPRHISMRDVGSGPETNWRTGGDGAATTLAADRGLVAVVNNLPDPAAQQAAVVFESAGILNLASGGPSLGMSAPLLSTVTVVPESAARASVLTRMVPAAISASLGRPVRSMGILFKERPPYNELSVQMMLKERSDANEVARVILLLQRLVSRGDMKADTTVGDVLRKYRMLLTPTQVSLFKKIMARLAAFPRVRSMTLANMFKEFVPQQMLVDVPYVQSYSPFTTNFRDYLSAFQGTGADVLYILDDPVEAVHIIRQFREMGVTTPVVLVELTDADRIAVELGGFSDNIYSVAVYPADLATPGYLELKRSYHAYLESLGLAPNDPDGQSMLGYESVWLLASCFTRTKSVMPSVLAGTFQHSVEPWPGRFGNTYKFNTFGQAVGGRLFPVRLLHGRLVGVEVNRAVLPK